MRELWTDKYRPVSVDNYVFTDSDTKQQISQWITEKSLPHLLLHGPAGTGKTTLAKILVNELEIHDYDFMQVNASRDNGVDFIRSKIEGFISTMPFGELKVVLLDECLDENTLVSVLRNGEIISIPIKDVDDESDLVKSFNLEKNSIEWMPFEKMYKGEQNTYTIELENGESVTCTDSHKWYVYDENNELKIVRTDEINEYMHIVSPK